ncbi:MAG: DUF3656 domain-containing protein [Clostridia bacterium]|nr:DUF3656 domain-containing protein [Clostridia bacterium]
MVELLSPVGDFECLKAAVQNGANCVYFGATSFSARASASNFNSENLAKAIEYAKLRGVRTNLTLNTLIKDEEFEDAYNLAKKAYEFGIDAIIVQDLGLGLKLIKDFPDLAVHASTQMSVHNLHGVLQLQELGFKRVVLARELSAPEIEYICKNSDVEIECFIHGALCFCYSGQCLFSSMIGGRSGNRGKCAQPCRLPYNLVNKEGTKIDNGYIISPKDLCGLEFLPFLINAGVTSFKIEGRMKTPEYVAIVTRIYRKYIDLALSGKEFVIDNKDKKDLLQVFNRGLSSTGHLQKDANTDLIYKEKPNNMGLPLGIVQSYNKNKGYITLKLKENVQIGDTISLEKENGTYTISELMEENFNKLENIEIGKINQTVVIGRMKGNINLGDKVFKMSSKELNLSALNSIKQENRKIPLLAKVTIKKGLPISIRVKSSSEIDLYKNLDLTFYLNEMPIEAINKPLDTSTVIEKINKTGNTIYEFSKITVELDKNVFITKLSLLNELRRNILEMVKDYAIQKIARKPINKAILMSKINITKKGNPKISVLLNILNENYDYSKLENIDNLYIPLKYFSDKKYSNILNILCNKFNLYIYLPTIIKANYRNLFYNNIEKAMDLYKIKGFVVSNISNFVLIKDLLEKYNNLELIANYTFNIYNNFTIKELKSLGITKYNVSPELDKNAILSLGNYCKKELIVYGKIPVINTNYCLLGKTNKCYPKCEAECLNSDETYYLKDRMNMDFEILPDNIQTVTTIYNSKIFSILPSEFNLDFARIDILHEDISKINEIINKVKNNERFEGKEFTNGNLNREI